MDADSATRLIIDHMVRADANRRGHIVVELATLTLMIDAKLVTIEEAAQRIEKIQSVLPPAYQAEDVSLRVKWITDWLRDHDKKPREPWRPLVIEGGLDQDQISDPDLPKT
jgi:hypothetical protein